MSAAGQTQTLSLLIEIFPIKGGFEEKNAHKGHLTSLVCDAELYWN